MSSDSKSLSLDKLELSQLESLNKEKEKELNHEINKLMKFTKSQINLNALCSRQIQFSIERNLQVNPSQHLFNYKQISNQSNAHKFAKKQISSSQIKNEINDLRIEVSKAEKDLKELNDYSLSK
ncbi:hypothetical protein TVAG_067840 [Trichomonas vaginalis G3]|uniref:Uncharacterized protein n=1 Tax=Trichomonas vaginalis (strain ATCC PRA-98 / G3) TaxID=412133 RepID=A2EMG8_TRIV3|nr:hypothetical protein TVAGG3_0499170 [Trichomonas vaginalis G3]EAY06124.1 hypothetical protein TVAG_067840 [Trichomonas vaginalis G3]KAI5516947.1 hypothetical protein TVAGG3_0499170 [Trichomonas vaginalis G3]|eukprot:XP_001318347.1 hypothetical protein [Trichomonas vaginalis G3]